jgi:tetratricopeptide (TPR) repeat protein
MRDDLVLFGARYEPSPSAPPERREAHAREMLSRALNRRQVIAFVGSGCSASLGYPLGRGFVSRLVATALDEAKALAPDACARFDLLRLADARRQLDEGAPADAKRLMWLASEAECVLVAAHPKEPERFRRCAAALFAPPDERRDGPPSPHDLLAELRITRFVTTNYDVEIERALARRKGIDFAEFGIGGGVGSATRTSTSRSFTQEPQFAGRHALFAVSRADPDEELVFHCHGRYDRPESLVITEADYQHWYLRESDARSSVFRQTLDLLFGSAPILFAGYSLSDEDLLRPLRLLSAREREPRDRSMPRGTARPLFALVPFDDEAACREEAKYFLQRYGVHVLPFRSPRGGAAGGEALCDALRRVNRDWERWRTGWVEKPVLRTVVVSARPENGPFWHYHPEHEPHDQPQLGDRSVGAQVDRWREALRGGLRVLGIVGPGGTGKSWHAIRLARTFERDRAFDGVFFWSSYYTNDRITGIDRLLGYADPGAPRDTPRLERLGKVLCEKKLLVVLDGVERLLRAGDTPDVGEPAVPGVKTLFELFLRPGCKSALVITSRLWPRQFDDAERAGSTTVHRAKLLRLAPADLDVPDFAGVDPDARSEICSLLSGHAFGLALAARHVGRLPQNERRLEFSRIRDRLATSSPHERLNVMIGAAIRGADAESAGLASKLLERVAVFMGPVMESTLAVCTASAAAEAERPDTPTHDWRRVVEDLIRRRLVLRITAGVGESVPPAYTAHPTVRGYVFERFHEVDRDIVPNFTLPGYTSGTAAVYPGSERGVKLVQDMFGHLHDATEAALARRDLPEARRLCRGLFGVVRSRMEANTSPRWCTYDDHLSYTMALANLAKRVSPRLWSQCDFHEAARVEDADGPLYADELAWLYNDIGLSLCGEGDMPDAYGVWEQGYEINRVIEGRSSTRQYVLQSQLHLGHVFIDLGRLDTARQYLEECERTNALLDDEDYRGRILGYRALVEHLRNDLTLAGELYEAAHEHIRKAGRNVRADGLFHMHHAALLIHLRKFDDAERLVRTAHASAVADRHPDLVARAHLTRGTLLRAQRKMRRAIPEFERALGEARRIGCRRLEADVLGEQSRLALDLGEFSVARQRAVEALRIANELSLGLRQTHGLVVLGRALVASGQRALGIEYLQHARALGESQGYALRVEETEEELVRLGVDLAPDALASGRGVTDLLLGGRRPPRTMGARA